MTALLSGLYPALVYSRMRPISMLRAKAGRSRGSGRLRRALVVFQFAVAVALVFSVLVVSQQLRYLTHRDLGFRSENVLVVDRALVVRDHWEALKKRSSASPEPPARPAPPRSRGGRPARSTSGARAAAATTSRPPG